ncbi:MAG: hypothetical protein ACE361_22075 [Aureliella sp.]
MTSYQNQTPDEFDELFAGLRENEPTGSAAAPIRVETVRLKVERRAKTRRQFRAASLTTACLLLLGFCGWQWSLRQSYSNQAPLVAENPEIAPSEPRLTQDLELASKSKATVADDIGSASNLIESKPRIDALLAELEQLSIETQKFTAELNGGSLEQRIALAESELLQNIRLQSRSEYLLSLN